MAIASIAVNNTLRMKDIIGELVPHYDETPDEIIKLGPDVRINIDPNGDCTIYYILKNKWKFYPLNTRVIINNGNAEVYYNRDQYVCPLSNIICYEENLYNVYNSYIIDENTLSCDPFCVNRMLNTKVPIIGLYKKRMINFIFNFTDARKLYSHVFNIMKTNILLADELVNIITTEYFGCDAKDKYNPCDFPYEFECKYANEAPKKISSPQLLKMYELGMLKIVKGMQKQETSLNLDRTYYYTEYYVLSDEAFDNNPDNVLRNYFKTKDKMHEYIQEGLNEYFNPLCEY